MIRFLGLIVAVSIFWSGSVSADIETKEFTYAGDGVEMTGFLAWDASIEGPRPGVLVVHEWWGQNEYPRERAKMLAEGQLDTRAIISHVLPYTRYAEGSEELYDMATDPGQFTAHAECITATVENGQICIDLPLGLGHKCISIPTKFGDGTKAQACLDICTKFGVPTGVKVYVTIDGITVAQKTFGVC